MSGKRLRSSSFDRHGTALAPSPHRIAPGWLGLMALPLLLVSCRLFLPSLTHEQVLARQRHAATQELPPPQPTPTPEPAPTPRPMQPTSATTTSTQTRAGNPQAWGAGSAIDLARIFSPIYFDHDSAELNPTARHHLNRYARWIKQHPRVWFTVNGHSDPRGTFEYNYNLAMARAIAVRDYLIGRDVASFRLFPISYGESESSNGTPSEETRALDRRVELKGFMAPVGSERPQPVEVAPGQSPAPQQADAPPHATNLE